MASKRYQSFSLVFLAMVTLILTQSAEARFRGINQFCKTSDYRALCTRMVHGAASLREATANAIHSALGLATQMQSMIHLIEPTLVDLPPQSKDSIIQTCKENFDSSVDNLNQALQYLSAGDSNSMNSYLSAVTTSDCSDGFQQLGALIPDKLAKIVGLLDREVSNCLAVSLQV